MGPQRSSEFSTILENKYSPPGQRVLLAQFSSSWLDYLHPLTDPLNLTFVDPHPTPEIVVAGGDPTIDLSDAGRKLFFFRNTKHVSGHPLLFTGRDSGVPTIVPPVLTSSSNRVIIFPAKMFFLLPSWLSDSSPLSELRHSRWTPYWSPSRDCGCFH
jgi:hypothetical protein